MAVNFWMTAHRSLTFFQIRRLAESRGAAKKHNFRVADRPAHIERPTQSSSRCAIVSTRHPAPKTLTETRPGTTVQRSVEFVNQLMTNIRRIGYNEADGQRVVPRLRRIRKSFWAPVSASLSANIASDSSLGSLENLPGRHFPDRRLGSLIGFDPFTEEAGSLTERTHNHEFEAFFRNKPQRLPAGVVPYAIVPGMLNSISVPAPRELHMFNCPPICLARSRIPGRP